MSRIQPSDDGKKHMTRNMTTKKSLSYQKEVFNLNSVPTHHDRSELDFNNCDLAYRNSGSVICAGLFDAEMAVTARADCAT
jgi:hypothetical protein